MATTLEIIRGISQAAANAYDGAHMEGYSSDGKARTIGLKREEGNPITDKRVMDGFGVAFHGKPMLREKIPLQLNHTDLTGLLYLQGYTADAFISG